MWWSEILALTVNCHRDPKKSKPATADSIHPYRPKTKANKGSSVKDAIGAVKARYGGVKGVENGER